MYGCPLCCALRRQSFWRQPDFLVGNFATTAYDALHATRPGHDSAQCGSMLECVLDNNPTCCRIYRLRQRSMRHLQFDVVRPAFRSSVCRCTLARSSSRTTVHSMAACRYSKPQFNNLLLSNNKRSVARTVGLCACRVECYWDSPAHEHR